MHNFIFSGRERYVSYIICKTRFFTSSKTVGFFSYLAQEATQAYKCRNFSFFFLLKFNFQIDFFNNRFHTKDNLYVTSKL